MNTITSAWTLLSPVVSIRVKRLLALNRLTGIEARASILPFDKGFATLSTPPSIHEIDKIFSKAGVDLTVQACKKALKEWGGSYKDITHTIAVTWTNSGNPGYDLLVDQKLGLRDNVDRMLLQGVGCSGGLAILRAAAQVANGASLLKQPARVLAFACELSSPNIRCAFDAAANNQNPENFDSSGAFYGDGAAAFVLCNNFAPEARRKGIFEVVNWANACIPGTADKIGVLSSPTG
jgi:type III polyketide synthase